MKEEWFSRCDSDPPLQLCSNALSSDRADRVEEMVNSPGQIPEVVGSIPTVIMTGDRRRPVS